MPARDLARALPTVALLILGFGCAHDAPTSAASTEPATFRATVSGHGRPVVLIPDLEASGDVWQSTVAHLGDRYQVHVIDIAGFAGMPPVPGPLVPQLRDQLARYLHTQARGAVLVGHMFGAELAWWLAMTEPDVVGGVIAIDAPPSRSDGTVDPEVEEMRQTLATASPEKYAQLVTHRLTSSISDPEMAKRLVAKAVLTTPSVDAEAFYDDLTRDQRPLIPKIAAPVLLLLTTENFPKPAFAEIQQAFAAQLAPIPHHELVVVPGAHHYVMFDAPDVFFAALDRFLAASP